MSRASCRVVGAVLCSLLVLAGGCRSVPKDPFLAGEQALERGELLTALAHLDRVSPRDSRYAEARAIALAVERRMRKAQEFMMRGLELRAEWRDEEAIPWFERAQEVWPDAVGAAEMVAATKARLAMLEGPSPVPGTDPSDDPGMQGTVATTTTVESGEVAVTRTVEPASADESVPWGMTPVGGDEPFQLPAVPGGSVPVVALTTPVDPIAGGAQQDPVAQGEAVPAPGVGPADMGEPEPAGPLEPPPSPEQLAQARLQASLQEVESLLRSGQMDLGLERLEQLAGEYPRVPLVQERLLRVLHQRALLRYGQGHLAAAIADWERVQQLAPGFKPAIQFAAAARAELSLREL